MHQHILNHNFAALFVGMSLGKTITSLTATNDLLNWCEVAKPLIVAPRLVAEKTWSDEVIEWNHVSHLKISKIIGTAKQRKKALTAEADVWIISRDNLAWLVNLCGSMWPFDMVILDESTSFKSHDSLRFKKMKEAMKYGVIKRMLHLTGTPVPNGLLDLWAPLYLLDGGERLGK
jgi:SNF2 family DNA or RNA helicase